MGMPTDVGIIDTMIGFPHHDMKAVYAFITKQTKDAQSKEEFTFPAEYMFKNVPEKALTEESDPIGVTIGEMDRWGIERGMIGVGQTGDQGDLALKRYPDRFIPSGSVDPNRGMDCVRDMVRWYETWGIRSVGCFPQVPTRRSPSTTRRCIPSTPSASSWASRSSAAPAFQDPA